MTRNYSVQTSKRNQMVSITKLAAEAVASSGTSQGICHVFVPHTTAGVTIQENADPDVVTDFLGILETLVPQRADYRHAEGNSDSHMKASLVGSSVSMPFEDGRLLLGTWQAVYLCEFDGPRTRQVLVTTVV